MELIGVNQKVFDQFPEIQTERLLLRQIRPEDAEEIMRMRQSKRVNRFIARNPMENLEDAKLLVEKTSEAFRSKSGIGWAGILRDGQFIIGTCGFNKIDFQNNRAEIGGELSVDFWGKNIAVEAVRGIVAFGFHEMNLHSIEAVVSPDNRGAIYLLESLGFEKEAHFKERICFRDKYLDMAVYTVFRASFRS